MQVKLALVVILLALGSSSAMSSVFKIQKDPWSACKAINETQMCYRSRETKCMRTSDNYTAPWYYCEDGGLDRPFTVEICDAGSCVQDCVVTDWSDWTECNCGQDFYLNRTREVVAPPRNGGAPCPALLERQLCQKCLNNALFHVIPRQHTWRTGSWGACRALDTTRGCGSGIQNRSLHCVGVDGIEDDDLSECRNERAYSSLDAPPTSRLCTVPCDCVVGEWSECQSMCDVSTTHTVQIRSRSVPSPDGAECLPLLETRECPNSAPPSCPTYFWITSDWTVCRYYGNAVCGDGYMTRYLYCVTDNNGTMQFVDQTMCPTQRPPQVSPCHVECPQACVVGAWSTWSNCTPSCEATYSNRTREVLVTPRGEGVCPHTLELRECPRTECVQWVASGYSDCYIPPSQVSG